MLGRSLIKLPVGTSIPENMHLNKISLFPMKDLKGDARCRGQCVLGADFNRSLVHDTGEKFE